MSESERGFVCVTNDVLQDGWQCYIPHHAVHSVSVYGWVCVSVVLWVSVWMDVCWCVEGCV